MKRFWTTEKYRLQQKRRARKEALRRPEKRGGNLRSRAPGGAIRLFAPSVLSVFDNPKETLVFCNELRAALRRPKTRIGIDLSGVRRFSSDALLLMRAVMDDRGARGWRNTVSGNMPSDADVAAKFKATGFFAGFAKPPAELPSAKGLIMKKSSRQVYSDQAAELVRFARANADIRTAVANACSRTLVEAMTNTHMHAGEEDLRGKRHRKRLPRPWSASVYCEDGVAHFTFVDLGVGIVRSMPAKRYLKVLGVPVTTYGESQLLTDAFRGVIGSSTGRPGRGLGLPRMKTDVDGGLLPNLQVLTSSVIGQVSDLSFRRLDESLGGTVLRWRAGKERTGGMTSIRVAEFTKLPGPRYRSEGPNSGEQFRDERLIPAFDAALNAGEQLRVDLDGVEFGYPASFLEEAFGGLARGKGSDAVLKTLVFVSTEEPLLEREIRSYIRHANETKPPAERFAVS